jgi:hypothetical protein
MLRFILENSGTIILVTGVGLFGYHGLKAARRMEKSREKRVELMERVKRLNDQLQSRQG